MKPIRIKMAHQLIVNYGLYRKMEVYEPHWATLNELTNFHSKDYIEYMESISKKPDTVTSSKQCKLLFNKIILERLIVQYSMECLLSRR